jgi:SAM-dependent methyltransferase
MTALLRHPALRRTLKRVPGLVPANNARRRLAYELNAVAHGLRAGRIATRLAGQEIMRQSIPGPATAIPVPAAARVVTAGPLSDDEIHARVLVANLLHRRGLGPRLYDARRTADGTAFALEPTEAEVAPPADSRRVLEAVGRLIDDGLLAPRDASWREPANVGGSGDGARYTAFDRLQVADERRMIDEVLSREARSELHFGREYRLRGNRYLYQSVPGVGAAGRRNSRVRWDRMRDLLAGAAVKLENRLVLDVGCNAGMMLAAALSDGAVWGVGWDLPAVAGRAGEVLSALGFTRLDTVGADLVPAYPLTRDVPEHLAPLLDGCVVLYLAVSHHIGFLDELADIPWSAIVFEGGEEQSVATLEADLAPLRERCSFRLVGGVDYRDGEGQMRPLALLLRDPSPSLA